MIHLITSKSCSSTRLQRSPLTFLVGLMSHTGHENWRLLVRSPVGPISFSNLMVIIQKGFTPLSTLTVALTMVMWESSQWNIVLSYVKQENAGKHR